MKKALIVWGGWDGHQPKEVGEFLGEILRDNGFEVEISDTLDTFRRYGEELKQLSLIVPVWTMGKITGEEQAPVIAAVESGVGIAGCHGGMCDSFRESTEWQFMTGGQWVAHPGDGGVEYTVEIADSSHEITSGMIAFPVKSEQYYMHTDPANKVLMTTRFPVAAGPHTPNGPFDMPVTWTRMHGNGRVFYTSLGHHVDVLEREPVPEILKRGMLWAAR